MERTGIGAVLTEGFCSNLMGLSIMDVVWNFLEYSLNDHAPAGVRVAAHVSKASVYHTL